MHELCVYASQQAAHRRCPRIQGAHRRDETREQLRRARGAAPRAPLAAAAAVAVVDAVEAAAAAAAAHAHALVAGEAVAARAAVGELLFNGFELGLALLVVPRVPQRLGAEEEEERRRGVVRPGLGDLFLDWVGGLGWAWCRWCVETSHAQPSPQPAAKSQQAQTPLGATQ